jgi:hypothetical protein
MSSSFPQRSGDHLARRAPSALRSTCADCYWGQQALARRREGFVAGRHSRDQWVQMPRRGDPDPHATRQLSQFCLAAAIFRKQCLGALLHLHNRLRDVLNPF